MSFDLDYVKQREQDLLFAASTLKGEFYGLDSIIDRVIASVTAWYTFPQLITRPVIVNLWGLTGVGKTALVRRLVELLNFKDKFVEIQMDGVSSSSSYYSVGSISGVLLDSGIQQGEPGIILLDEYQRYRTIAQDGSDVKVERFADVWMLLSDGHFAANSSVYQEIEMMIAMSAYDDDYRTSRESDSDDKNQKKRKFKIYPYEAKSIKKRLNLPNSLKEIMEWSPEELAENIEVALENSVGNQIDYTKCLIFVSGNLDEVFRAASNINDCDTDANVFHERTKKISVMNVKAALKQRFKPEQIARLGNTHIIYPSISKEAYQQIIHNAVTSYVDIMAEVSGLEFKWDSHTEEVIYKNGVYPTQGTRPVFSSIHSILGTGLVQMAAWAIKKNVNQIDLTIDTDKSVLIGKSASGLEEMEFPVVLDVHAEKKKASEDFLLTVAVHEAGHAILHAVLTHTAPQEVKINTASFAGGYMLPEEEGQIVSKEDFRNKLTTLYGGRMAEEIVFGADFISTGASSDIDKATRLASHYVRCYAFDLLPGVEFQPSGRETPDGLNPSDEASKAVEQLLTDERERAKVLLLENKHYLIRLVEHLIEKIEMNQAEFTALFPELVYSVESERIKAWDSFKG